MECTEERGNMSGDLKVVTYNLRNQWWVDEQNGFAHRAGYLYMVVEKEKPDVIAFQEVMDTQLKYLEKIMPEYVFVGHGREKNFNGEGLYTAIRKDTCMLCSTEVFWLSPEPYTPGSLFPEQTPYPRICVNSMIRHKEAGKLFHVYNVHLDYLESPAQEKGIAVVLEKMVEDQGKVTSEGILLGDFNDQPTGRAIVYCNNFDKLKLTDITKDIEITYHGYGLNPAVKIDYIYTTEGLTGALESVKPWDHNHSGIYLSDHYPVCAVFKLS